MRIAIVNNAVWFTFQFGNSGWEEAPFSLHLSQLADKENYIDLCKTLRVITIDTENGRIAVIMEIDINSEAQKTIKSYIDSTFKMPFEKNIYNYSLLNVQSRYSVEQIAQASMQIIYCR